MLQIAIIFPKWLNTSANCCLFSFAETACRWYIDKTRFHARTYTWFAPRFEKKQMEKIEIQVPAMEQTILVKPLKMKYNHL